MWRPGLEGDVEDACILCSGVHSCLGRWWQLVTLYRTGIKTIPMEKKCKKAKWLSGEDLQIAVKRREAKSKGEKER